jgi:hypothetical protein
VPTRVHCHQRRARTSARPPASSSSATTACRQPPSRCGASGSAPVLRQTRGRDRRHGRRAPRLIARIVSRGRASCASRVAVHGHGLSRDRGSPTPRGVPGAAACPSMSTLRSADAPTRSRSRRGASVSGHVQRVLAPDDLEEPDPPADTRPRSPAIAIVRVRSAGAACRVVGHAPDPAIRSRRRLVAFLSANDERDA